MNDATATSPTNYDLNVCQANARRAATDPKAVYLVGPFNSGCAEVEIPITNQGGLPQVSPANTYPGLTTNDPGTSPGEPQKYYPTGKRTYLRIVPRDTIQGIAGLVAMKQAGCTRVAVANDKTPYGVGLATQIILDHGDYGLTLAGTSGSSGTGLDPTAPNYRSYASSLKAAGVNCVYTGFNPPGEVELIKDINSAHPDRQDLRRRRRLLRWGDQSEERRVPGEHRAAVPVHGGDAGPHLLPGRHGSSSPPTRPSTESQTPIRTRSTATRR